MYYENKRSFYIKQYGPVALVVVIALALIVTGTVIGLKSMNNSNQVAEAPKEDAPVASNDVVVEQNSFSQDAITGTVTKVSGTTVTVKENNSTYDVNLIGIATSDKNTTLPETIAKDLKGRTITVDFDNVKTEDGKIYGYVYLDGALYNAKLLANGEAELRTERQNINKLNVLVAAQIQARHNGLGIWKY